MMSLLPLQKSQHSHRLAISVAIPRFDSWGLVVRLANKETYSTNSIISPW